jgi:hypothetical protein
MHTFQNTRMHVRTRAHARVGTNTPSNECTTGSVGPVNICLIPINILTTVGMCQITYTYMYIKDLNWYNTRDIIWV